jgi:FixJ family two-component response regulator
VNEKPWVALVSTSRSTGRKLSQVLEGSGFSVEVFESTRDFLRSPEREQAGCLVVDLSAPSGIDRPRGNSGPEIAYIPVPVILITPPSQRPVTARWDLGAASDPTEYGALAEAVTAAIEDSASSRPRLLQSSAFAHRLSLLTPREREVMNLVINGLSNRRIASRCGISPRTVEIHRARVMEKMGAGSLSELVRIVCLQHAPDPHGGFDEPEPDLDRAAAQRRKG